MKQAILEKKWVVVYTRSKWEKKVDQLLKEQCIHSFCPVVKRRRQWADRSKEVEFPLFSSYVFVHADPKEELMVRRTSGVVDFIYHCGRPAVVRASEIDRIRSLVMEYKDVETIPLQKLHIGDKVKIKEGPLVDWQGEVIQINGKSVIMVMEVLNCALLAKVKAHQTKLVG